MSSPSAFVTLPEQIARLIADAIMKNEIEPGSNLREIPLAEKFSVSRSSVREALRILERDGVVSIRPRHGAKVTDLSAVEMAEIYQIRAALLGVAFELYTQHAKKTDLKILEEKLAKMEVVVASEDSIKALIHAELSASMADFIFQRCGNAKLAMLLNQMSLQVARYTLLGLSTEARRQQSIHNWTQVLTAMHTANAAAANHAGQQMVKDNLDFALHLLEHSR